MAVSDPVAEWFDYWIDTYSHPDTRLYANRWTQANKARQRATVGTIEQGGSPHIYEIERSDA